MRLHARQGLDDNMKRWLSLAMCLPVALSVTLFFGGCSVERTAGESGDTTKAGKDLTVVSFTELYMDKDGTDFNDAKKAYENKYGGTVSFKRYPANMFINKMITLIGSGSSPDLAYCRWAEMPKLAAMAINLYNILSRIAVRCTHQKD